MDRQIDLAEGAVADELYEHVIFEGCGRELLEFSNVLSVVLNYFLSFFHDFLI